MGVAKQQRVNILLFIKICGTIKRHRANLGIKFFLWGLINFNLPEDNGS